MTQLIQGIIFALVLSLFSLFEAKAQSFKGDYIRLYPKTLPIVCSSGDIRVSSSDGAMKLCVLGSWATLVDTSAAFNDPMTTDGDIIVRSSGSPARLGIGATNYVLLSDGTTPTYALITDSNVSPTAGLAATKIADGSVTNAEFQYLDATSSIQTQLDGKQATGNYITALTGDGTASGPGSSSLTLATVNSNVGSFGGASKYTAFTVNSKGLITAASEGNIAIGQTQVTNLVSDLAGKQATGNYITALTGDVTATGPGSVAATLATVGPTKGGTGLTSYTKGDLLYSSATNTLAKLGIGTTNQILTSSGSAPQWTSTLSIAQGGTNNGSLAVTAGGVLYTDGSKIMNVGIGTTGQFLTSQASSPPTWTTVAAKSTGEVFMTASTSCPTGSMAADGSSLLRSGGTDCGGGSCASLFSAISTTYGTVDGTHFTLPDLRGVFVRGQGTQTISAISYTGTQGTTEGDQFQGHRHMMRVPATAGGASLWGFTLWTASRSTTLSDSAAAGEDSIGVPITGTHGTPRYGSETRPANVVLKYCIVY